MIGRCFAPIAPAQSLPPDHQIDGATKWLRSRPKRIAMRKPQANVTTVATVKTKAKPNPNPAALSAQESRKKHRRAINALLQKFLGSAIPLNSVAGDDAMTAVIAAFAAGQRAGAAEARAQYAEKIADTKPATSSAHQSRVDGYQTMVDGGEKKVCDLTLEEAQLQVCACIDALERMDSLVADASDVMSAWRHGKPVEQIG